MTRLSLPARRFGAFAAVAAIVVAACGGAASPTPSGGGGAAVISSVSGTIALLLPEKTTARYEAADKPFFEARLKQVCPNITMDYQNASEDATAQQGQAEAEIAKGVKVLVLDPVDGKAAGVIVGNSQAKSIPVISYDRLVTGTGSKPNYYISFDNFQVGVLQATTLLNKLTSMNLGRQAKITMINGSPKDNNATLFKQGAHSVFDGKVTIVKEDAAANWLPAEAQQLMDGFIAALGKGGFDAAYQANDGTAGGAIASMKTAGIDPKTIPTTGQDAQLDAIQRILVGEQYMTVYKAIQPEAEKAADLACYLASGTAVPADMTGGKTVNNGTIDVPSVLLVPIAVTADGKEAGTKSVKDSVVKDQFFGSDTVTKICTADFAAGCKQYGIQ